MTLVLQLKESSQVPGRAALKASSMFGQGYQGPQAAVRGLSHLSERKQLRTGRGEMRTFRFVFGEERNPFLKTLILVFDSQEFSAEIRTELLLKLLG